MRQPASLLRLVSLDTSVEYPWGPTSNQVGTAPSLVPPLLHGSFTHDSYRAYKATYAVVGGGGVCLCSSVLKRVGFRFISRDLY